MSVMDVMNKKLFYMYNDRDPFIRSFAKFLFFISALFFTLMFILFFINLPKLGLLRAFITCGTSCISSILSIILIVKGRGRTAGAVFAIVQTIIFVAGLSTRTPELSLVTLIYFAFPTVILATVFSYRWVHISVACVIVTVIIINFLRFDISKVVHTPEHLAYLVLIGTIMAVANFLLVYLFAVVTIRSTRIALKMSKDEANKSSQKNEYIVELINTIRKSYNELTDAMGVTDQAVSNIIMNMQTEAATIEELVASIEEVSSSTMSVETATKEQNDSVNELTESIESLSKLIDSLQVFGSELQKQFTNIGEMSELGRSSTAELNEVNRKTLSNSDNMQMITGIIDDFFDRINLLSLNASIEAARAGEHGRGFAVVADEIGKLADNSSSELKKIKDLIETSRNDAVFSNSIIARIIDFIESLGVSLNDLQVKAMETMNVIQGQENIRGDMLLRNRKVFEKSEIIRDASAEQTLAMQEIGKSVESTNSLVQENTQSAESLNRSYDRMKKIAGELKQIMDEKS